MSKLFATELDVPLLHEGYPLTFVLAMGHQVQQRLYFERVYLDVFGEQLAVRSTLIELRGMVQLTEAGPAPDGTARIEVSVTNQSRATEPDPVWQVPVEQEPLPAFATELDVPLLHENYPLHLAIGIGGTLQPLYLVREYLSAAQQEIAVRSSPIDNRNMLAGFNIHTPGPPFGARWVKAYISNQYRQTDRAATLEYESLEYNELEYN